MSKLTVRLFTPSEIKRGDCFRGLVSYVFIAWDSKASGYVGAIKDAKTHQILREHLLVNLPHTLQMWDMLYVVARLHQTRIQTNQSVIGFAVEGRIAELLGITPGQAYKVEVQ